MITFRLRATPFRFCCLLRGAAVRGTVLYSAPLFGLVAHPLYSACLFVLFPVFSCLFVFFPVFSAFWPSCVQCMSFRPLSVGFPGGGCAAPSWFVRWFGGCCSLLCHAGCLVVWCAPFSAALALGCEFSGGWLVLCSGPAFSGCAPLELGLYCALLGKKKVSYTLHIVSKSVLDTLYSVKKCIIQ